MPSSADDKEKQSSKIPELLRPPTAHELNSSFERRIQGAIGTAQAWDDDPSLLAECRAMIPFELLRDNNVVGTSGSAQAGGTDDTAAAVKGDGSTTEATAAAVAAEVFPFHKPSDCDLSPDVRFLLRLSRFFKDSMTWVNSPPCSSCQNPKTTQLKETRSPQTEEERVGNASRVEVYHCTECKAITNFPRYNSPRKLLETKKGRCGEYANLFGLYCRSLGLETRYIMDVTDHVWIEVWIRDDSPGSVHGGGYWMMVDACEAVVGETSMYEAGWGKKMSYIIAASVNHVVDVTPRYTRAFQSERMQKRRLEVTSTEVAGEEVVEKLSRTLQAGLAPKARQELQQKLAVEGQVLTSMKSMTEWTKEYKRGRISGSLVWKLARREAGALRSKSKSKGKKQDKDTELPPQFHVESFYPTPSDNRVSITVNARNVSSRYEGIVVSGTPCAMSTSNNNDDNDKKGSISVVVIDESAEYLGCVLQSRCFDSAASLAEFLDLLPSHRIVAMRGSLKQPVATTTTTSASDEKKSDGGDNKSSNTTAVSATSSASGSSALSDTFIRKTLFRLGGFEAELLPEGVLYVGQVDAHPEWAFCSTFDRAPKGHTIVQVKKNESGGGDVKQTSQQESLWKLKTECKSRTGIVVGRIPDEIMPLATQLEATHEQKRSIFLKFMGSNQNPSNGDGKENDRRSLYAGYITQPKAPIYLLGSASFPLERMEALPTKQSPSSQTKAYRQQQVLSKPQWHTFLWLPAPLVPEDDVGAVGGSDDEGNDELKASEAVKGGPSFESPVDSAFFEQHVGRELLIKTPGSTGRNASLKEPTRAALKNSRLVGLYMSAHWCGPCRRFTPMLAEMYEHLKQEFPTHGLDIIFVSSDRDASSFNQYYETMPWHAIPFENVSSYQHLLSALYGVRGIPALIILDAISGQVVVSSDQSRNEVVQSCQRGEHAISAMMKSWLDRVPSDTKEIINLLELSCVDDRDPGIVTDENSERPFSEDTTLSHAPNHNSYLVRSKPSQKDETATLIKATFAELVAKGMTPNEAAAKAISTISTAQSKGEKIPLPSGPLNNAFASAAEVRATEEDAVSLRVKSILAQTDGTDLLTHILTTALKYLENANKTPWAAKFRTFKLSNKVADRITRIPDGIELLRSLGFDIVASIQDYCAYIPIAADLDAMCAKVTKLLEEYTKSNTTSASSSAVKDE